MGTVRYSNIVIPKNFLVNRPTGSDHRKWAAEESVFESEFEAFSRARLPLEGYGENHSYSQVEMDYIHGNLLPRQRASRPLYGSL